MPATFTVTGNLDTLLGADAVYTSGAVFATTQVVSLADGVVFDRSSEFSIVDGVFTLSLPAHDSTNRPWTGDVPELAPAFGFSIAIGQRRWSFPAMASGESVDLATVTDTYTAPVTPSSVERAELAQLAAEAAATTATESADTTLTQVPLVVAEGDRQTARVLNEGNVQVARVTTTGNQEVAAVDQAGDTEVARVRTEGDTQTNRVGATGTELVAATEGHANAANESANDAEASAASAALASEQAGTSEDNAAASATAAADSATAAEGSATEAASSAATSGQAVANHEAKTNPHPRYQPRASEDLPLEVADLNNLTIPGTYYRGSSLNPPANWPAAGFAGQIEVLASPSPSGWPQNIIQRATSVRSGPGATNAYQTQYVRSLFSTEGWGPWTRVGYYREGTGSPEGVVAASVGTRYTDVAATTGAVEWIKTTGPGFTTGWRVVYGDTGRRVFKTADLSNGYTTYIVNDAYSPALRREGNTVLLDGALTATNATASQFLAIPTGFRPMGNGRARGGLYGFSGAGVSMLVEVSGGWASLVYWNSRPTGFASGALGNITWITDDPWPTILPGTAS